MSERQFTVEEVSKHNKEGDLVSATLRLNAYTWLSFLSNGDLMMVIVGYHRLQGLRPFQVCGNAPWRSLCPLRRRNW